MALSRKYLAPIALSLLALSTVTLGLLSLPTAHSQSDSREDDEWKIDLAPHSSSKIYERPADANYFWWDAIEEDQREFYSKAKVEVIFSDGSKVVDSPEAEFSKRVSSVKFENQSDQALRVRLWARY